MPPFADPSRTVCQALKNACAPGNELPSRAMARNLLAEHRLSEERFAEFSTTTGELASIIQVHKAFEDYQVSHVRPFLKKGERPAYTRSDNANNIVVLPPDARLGTV